jgi:predicted negative regulator of RcsB-dependent stress response
MQSEATSTATFYKVWGWFETNTKEVLVGTVILIIVGVGVGFFVWRSGEKKVEAGEALSKAFVPQAGTGPQGPGAEGFLKVASEYPGSDAGAQALLFGAAALFDQGKFADARQQFEKFTREHRGNVFMAQALLGIAASYDAEGKTNEAVTAYKALMDRYPAENVVPQAKFSLARIYLNENKPEEAFRLYEEVARADSFGQLGSEASVRAEELKTKYPQLAPPPTPVTPAPVTITPAIPVTNSIVLKTNQ